MKIIPGFNLRSFLLAAFFAGLGFNNHAMADPFHRAYLIDLNSRTATDLGTLRGGASYGYGINDAGQVVGYLDPSTINGSSRAFITGPDGMGMRDLGTLGGNFNFANGINETGQVVGNTFTDSGDQRAFITGPDGTNLRDLGALGGDGFSYARGINDAGRVVGSSSVSDPPGTSHAFITGPDGEGMRDLGSIAAFDINDAGQVVGSFGAGFRSSHAFITGPNGEGMRDLGTLGGDDSSAYGINDMGQVVGSSTRFFDSPSHAFITGPDGTGMRDLGTLGGHSSVAWGINDAGQVVGTSSIAGIFHDEHAFIADPGGRMIDLNSLVDLPAGTVLIDARGINNAGQVIANAAVIPEPESYALLLAGLVLIGVVARRKRDTGVLRYHPE